MKGVKIIALKDISKEVTPVITRNSNGSFDYWVVCANRLDSIETRKLNRLLGLHKINK